jgi:hypothetical protein
MGGPFGIPKHIFAVAGHQNQMGMAAVENAGFRQVRVSLIPVVSGHLIYHSGHQSFGRAYRARTFVGDRIAFPPNLRW